MEDKILEDGTFRKNGIVRLQRFIEYTFPNKEIKIDRDATLYEDTTLSKSRKSHMDENKKGARGSKRCSGK